MTDAPVTEEDLVVVVDHVVEWHKRTEVTLSACDLAEIRTWAKIPKGEPIPQRTLREWFEEDTKCGEPVSWLPVEGWADYDCDGVNVWEVTSEDGRVFEEDPAVYDWPPGRPEETVVPDPQYV